MSGRIETYDSRKEQTSKWSQNEAFSVREAGVDIGKSGGQGGSNVSVDQVVTSGREVAGVTVDGERTPILIPNAGEWTQSDWAEEDPSDDAYIKNKPSLAQVATSGDYGDLGNTPDLSNFVEDSNYVHTDNNYDAGAKNIVDHVTDNLAGKVDKVTGKTLSDNNFTNAQKDKLTNLANIYGVGANLTLDPETNILSANAQPITIDTEMSSSSTNAVQNRVITAALGDKVDKVTGKVLSDNNFSNSDKQKLDGIDQGAEVNDISTISVNGVNVPADANKNVEITIPTKVSDLTNDSGFVANTVNNLVNYYLKSETYTQSEVDSLISAIVTLDIKAVATLPTTGISTTTIYLVPSSDPGTQNVKDEYVNTTGDSTGWELIGSTKIDLTGYVTDTELATALADYVTDTELTTALADYVTDTELTTALANYATTTAMSTALADKVDISDVDQTYDPTSTNPQSGVAVAAAVAEAGGHDFNDDDFVVDNNEVSLAPAQRIFTGTQAEWGALTLAEKQTYGQANITDDGSGTPEYYSTEEVKTNKVWIDGKPIYRKCFAITISQYSTSVIDVVLDSNLTKERISIVGFGGYLDVGTSGDNNMKTIPHIFTDANGDVSYVTTSASSQGLKLTYRRVNAGNTGYVWFEYTKTTD